MLRNSCLQTIWLSPSKNKELIVYSYKLAQLASVQIGTKRNFPANHQVKQSVSQVKVVAGWCRAGWALLLPCNCLKRPSKMLEYCTWLTNAAGDKQGSRSLWSQSMDIFPNLLFLLLSVFLVARKWVAILLHSRVEATTYTWKNKVSNPSGVEGNVRKNKKVSAISLVPRNSSMLSKDTAAVWKNKKAAVWWVLHSPCVSPTVNESAAMTFLSFPSSPPRRIFASLTEEKSGFSFHLRPRKKVMFATAVAVALIESSERSLLPSLVVLLRKNGRLPDCSFPPNCEAVPAECSRAG